MALSDTDALIAPDYLGVPSEVSTKGSASLPTDQPFQPSGAPSTASGSGAAPAAPSSASTTLGPRFSLTPPAAPSPLQGAQAPQGGIVTAGIDPVAAQEAARTIPIPDDIQNAVTGLPPEARESLLLKLVSMGGKFAEIGNELTKLFPDQPSVGQRDEQAFQAQRAGERLGFPSQPTDPAALRDPGNLDLGVFEGLAPDASPGNFDLGIFEGLTDFGSGNDLGVFQGFEAASSAGDAASGGAGSFAGAAAAFNAAKNINEILDSNMEGGQKAFESIFQVGRAVASYYLPVVGGYLADLVHEYISKPIASLFGEWGPSKNWINFPNELGQTLQLTESSNQKLAAGIANAQSPADLERVIAEWKSSIGTRVGGFGAGSGAYDIPDVPGATGTRHEGGINADFDPEIGGLRAMAEVARRGGSLAERIQAFRSGAIQAMDQQQRLGVDPSGSLLTPEMNESWKASLVEQTRIGAQSGDATAAKVNQALSSGQITPVQAQSILDAMSPGTTSFVTPASPELLAQFAPPAEGPKVSGFGTEYWNDPNLNTGG